MLVLTRRIGERIVIGHRIVFEILSVKGNRVRLGFQAPPDVIVLREERISADATPKPGGCPGVVDNEL